MLFRSDHPGPFGVYHKHGKGAEDLKIVSKHKTLDSALKHVNRLEKKTGKQHVYGNLLAHNPEHGEIPKKFHEEVEQIDELTGKGKLSQIADYHKQKSGEAKDKMEKIRSSNRKLPVPFELTSKISAKDNEAKYHSSQEKRAKALMGKGVMSNILKKVKNEEVEQIDELSKTTLGNYYNAAKQDNRDHADSRRSGDAEEAKWAKDRMVKRSTGMAAAKQRLNKEEVEQIDELSKSTLGSYAKKATRDARLRFAQGKDFERISKSSRKIIPSTSKCSTIFLVPLKIGIVPVAKQSKIFSVKYNFNYGILRYFNVAGSDMRNKIGCINKNNQLVKNISLSVTNNENKASIFGNNYRTKDGTCIRDYIHLEDISKIHSKLLKIISTKNTSYLLNCGYGVGYSDRKSTRLNSSH